jgi:inorganic pyrophosphatase
MLMDECGKKRKTILENVFEKKRRKIKPINIIAANKMKSIAEFSKKYQLLKRSMRDSQIMISNIANILLDYEKNYDLCRLERYKREEF